MILLQFRTPHSILIEKKVVGVEYVISPEFKHIPMEVV
jgi:hypothetical protein